MTLIPKPHKDTTNKTRGQFPDDHGTFFNKVYEKQMQENINNGYKMYM